MNSEDMIQLITVATVQQLKTIAYILTTVDLKHTTLYSAILLHLSISENQM
jgi:PDZ domain-containing secreted protein